jgi:hypothetical protein
MIARGGIARRRSIMRSNKELERDRAAMVMQPQAIAL